MLFWLGSAALLLRLLYFVQHSGSAFFLVPILDESFYDVVARTLVEGGDVGEVNPGFRPLLYPAFLASIYRLAELGSLDGHALALIFQHLLGLGTILLVASASARLFRRTWAGAAAGGLFLLAGPPLFFEGELLITTLVTFFFAIFLRGLASCNPLSLAPALGAAEQETATPETADEDRDESGRDLRDDSRESPTDTVSEAGGKLGPTASARPPAVGNLGRGLAAWMLAGLFLGLAAQTRANILVVAAAFPLMAMLGPWLKRSEAGARRGQNGTDQRRAARSRPGRAGFAIASLAAGGLAAGGAILMLVLSLGLAAGLQEPHFGRFELLPGAGGINLYLGNKRGADGMVPRQDSHQAYGNTYRDSVQLFAEQEYRAQIGDRAAVPDPAAISRFWLGKTLEEIRADPVGRGILLLRKSILLCWYREIPNNKSYAFFARQEAPLLHLLPIGFAALFGLAGLGAIGAWRRGDRHYLGWLLSVSALYAGGIVLFFVNGRFRLPLWVPLAILAGGGAVGLFELLRHTRRGAGQPRPSGHLLPVGRALIASLALGLALAVVSLIGWPGAEIGNFSRDYFFRSLAYYEKGDLEQARADASHAVDLEPSDPAAQFQLATVALAQDDLELARQHVLIAARLAPTEPRIANNLGVVLEKQGDVGQAYIAYQKALELDPSFIPALVNTALLDLRGRQPERAAELIARAEALGDRSVPLLCARAFLELGRGRPNLGRSLLAMALRRDPELTQRLVEEQDQPLAAAPKTP